MPQLPNTNSESTPEATSVAGGERRSRREIYEDPAPRIRKRTRSNKLPVAKGSDRPNREPAKLLIEYVGISSLQAYGRKLRTHNGRHIAAIEGSLANFGFLAPVLVDDNNVIVDGHALVVAAERLGFDEIPVVRLSHLSPDLIKVCRVALNKLAEGGQFDPNAINLEMVEIEPILVDHDINVEAVGFSVAELDLIAGSVKPGDSEPDDEEIPPAAFAVTKPGDCWLLGKHRLLCGNALEGGSFERLMVGEKARMAFCDAPYNLKVDGVVSGLGKAKHREFAMASGEMSRDEFISFLTTYMVNCAAHCVDGAVHFACMDWRHVLELVTAGEAAFDKFLNLIVWNKTNAGMGTMYRSQHELIGVFKSGTAPHINNFGLGNTGRYRTNVWTMAGANSFRKGRDEDLADHPTVKPTALVMDAIQDVSRRGEIVLDCFCGSGTTILAAEKTGRRGYGIELEPLYVDVAIKRYQALTGVDAVLESNGRTFNEVAGLGLDDDDEETANG